MNNTKISRRSFLAAAGIAGAAAALTACGSSALPALHLPWQALPLLLLKLPVDPWS